MPFSIKRFTMHRSSSLPNQSPRPVEGKKLTLVEIRESSDGGGKPSKKSEGGKALPTSRSVDAAELRRMASLDADCGRPGSHRHVGEYATRQEAVRQTQTLPNKFHKSRSLDHQRLYYEQVGGTEVRRLVLRRNGVRFQDSDWGTEESHSTSSSSGGGGVIRGHPGGVKPNEWAESEGHDPNGSRGSVRRSQPRRHHTLAGEHVSAASNTRLAMDLESHHLSAQRGPALYQPPPSVYDDDPGIMSEVETSATGFRRASKARSSLPIVRTPSKTQERPLGLVFLQYRSETKRALLPNEITTLDTVKALFVRSFSKQLTMEYLDSPHIRIYIHDPSKDMFYELEDLREIRDRSVLRIYEQDANGGGVYSTYDQDMSYFSEPEFDSEYQNQHIHRAKGSKSQLPQSSNYYGTVGPYPAVSRTQTLPHGASMRPYSPAPVERPKSQPLPPSVGFCQTLPRGMHLPSYNPTPLSPEKRQLELLTPPGSGQPPPKPQRSFQQSLGSKGVRSTPPPTGPPPSLSSSRSGQPRNLERRHEPQGGYRSTPERPYSAGQAYPSPERCYEPTYHSSPERRATHDSGYLSSPERRLDQQRSFSGYTSSSYDDSFYGERMYGSRSGSVTPVVDEEARIRVEFMERQLANLTGLVQKALASGSSQIPTRDTDVTIGKDKSERDGRGGKPAPPPKPASLSSSCSESRHYSPTKELHLGPELYSQLRYLRKQTKDLRLEVRNLRRMAQAQAVTARETVRDTCLKIKAMLAAAQGGEDQVCAERLRVSREEDLYRQDVNRLEKDLSELESQVEELRSNVINRRCRVNISDVESMALVLSRASKTVADLKARFPSLQESLKAVMAAEMEVVVREEKFLKEEPERLENALRRCKKLTGTLVTLKRLASVQEQRNTGGHHLPEKSASADSPHSDGEAHSARTIDSNPHTVIHVPPDGHQRALRTENALDALLDELQTFTKPSDHKNPQRRLPSYPSTDSPVRTPTHGPPAIPQKPAGGLIGRLQMAEAGNRHSVTLSPSQSPVPDGKDVFSRVSVSGTTKHTVINGPESLPAPGPPLPAKKVPPPPPPRTTSRSPITSPTTISAPHHPKKDIHIRSFSEPTPKNCPPSALQRIIPGRSASKEEEDELLRTSAIGDDNLRRDQLSSNSSSSESVNSQEGLQMALQGGKGLEGKRSAPSTPPRTTRQDLLEQRHQELLRKQKQLQEQYARLQQLQRGQILQRFSPPRTALGDLKKTGSESNILSKTALSLTPASGSLTHLAMNSAGTLLVPKAGGGITSKPGKIFETDIL